MTSAASIALYALGLVAAAVALPVAALLIAALCAGAVELAERVRRRWR